jgi:hypothetical protein
VCKVSDFKRKYWLCSELRVLCKKYDLPVSGVKADLTARIIRYLETGEIIHPVPKIKYTFRDSDKEMALEAKVVNYKNDAKTRAFFKKQIGSHFHFNVHLINFVKSNKNLTYEGLVQEWLAEEKRRENPNYKTKIHASCEYNRFIREFFAREKEKNLSDAIAEWKKLKDKRNK